MLYLIAKTPDGIELRLPAQVSKIHPDGTFDVRSLDGLMSIVAASPDSIRLENEDGSAATPTVYDPLDGLQQRLQEAEATIAELQRQLSLTHPNP